MTTKVSRASECSRVLSSSRLFFATSRLIASVEIEKSRIFRPRLLIRGLPGMGQQYLAGAVLSHFEGVHVQSFDLSTLLSDSTRVRNVLGISRAAYC
jgi:hypothetical protein